MKNTNIPDYIEKRRKKMTVKITLLNLFQNICQTLHVYPCVVLRPNKIIPVSGFATYPKHFITLLRRNITFMNKMSLIFLSVWSLFLQKIPKIVKKRLNMWLQMDVKSHFTLFCKPLWQQKKSAKFHSQRLMFFCAINGIFIFLLCIFIRLFY